MEQSLDIKRLLSHVRKAVDEYSMIAEGDKIAVGVSGGKDSLALLCAMAYLRRFYPQEFEICALCMDAGFYEVGYGDKEQTKAGFGKIEELCRLLDVKYYLLETHIAKVVFECKNEKNPCSLCAKMRRGALQNYAAELGCNKLALGHHFDDAVETFMLNLFNEGRIGCFPPKVHFDRSDITVIRPLVYAPEKDITYFVNKSHLPVIKSPCPQDKTSERENIKRLLRELERENKGVKQRIFGAMKRAGVDGYGK